jgi:hypothetical protein
MNRDDLLSEAFYVEDELGVYVYNLTGAELRVVAKVCTALAELPLEARKELYSKLNPDRIEDSEETLFDDDNESGLN